MNLCFINGLATGISVSLITYSVAKLIEFIRNTNEHLKDLTEAVTSIPGPEEMARQILSAKIPINDLPDSLQKEIKQELNKQEVSENVSRPEYMG